MPRVVKPGEKLATTINVPVSIKLKKLIARIAEAKGAHSHTELCREYITRGVTEDARATAAHA